MKILDTWFFIARCMRCILNGFEWVLTHSHLGLLLRIGHGETNPEIRGLAKLGSDAENDGNCVWKLCFIGYPQLLESAHSRKNGQKVPYKKVFCIAHSCPLGHLLIPSHTLALNFGEFSTPGHPWGFETAVLSLEALHWADRVQHPKRSVVTPALFCHWSPRRCATQQRFGESWDCFPSDPWWLSRL